MFWLCCVVVCVFVVGCVGGGSGGSVVVAPPVGESVEGSVGGGSVVVEGVLVLTSASVGSLSVGWGDDFAAGAVGFRLSWREIPAGGGGSGWSSVDLSGGSRAYVLGGLTAATPYRVRLVALDGDGVEGVAAVGRFETSGPAPRDVSAVASGESVTVGWGAPAGWEPAGYRLWWRPAGGEVFAGEVTLGAGTGSFVIDGVASGDYRVRVAALAASGYVGDAATVAVTVGDGVLSASAVGVDSFVVHWAEGFAPSAGGFRLRWREIPVPDDEALEWSVVDVDAATRQYGLGGLVAATPYRVRLSALGGDGADTEVTLGRFETSGPPPQSLAATSVAHDAVTLAWEAPADWVPVGYWLAWRPAGGSEFVGGYGLAPGRRSQTVTGLADGEEYVFRLTALTATGHQSDPATVRHVTRPALGGGLSLDVSVAAYCVAWDGQVERDTGFGLSDNGVDYETVITDILSVPSVPLSWRITGGVAPYTVSFLDTARGGAAGTAAASCVAPGVDLFAPDLNRSGAAIQPGPKTFTITATDATGNTATRTVTIEIIEIAGEFLDPGYTYYDTWSDRYIEVPEGYRLGCCGAVEADYDTYVSFVEITGKDRRSEIYIDNDGNEAPPYLSPRIGDATGHIHGESLSDAQRAMWDQFLASMRPTPFPEGDARNRPPVPLADTGGAGGVVPAQFPPFEPPPPAPQCADKKSAAELIAAGRDRPELVDLAPEAEKPGTGWRPYGVLSSHVTASADVIHGLPCDTGVLAHPNLLVGRTITVCVSIKAGLGAKDDLLVEALAEAIDGAATATTPAVGGWNTALEAGLGYRPFEFDKAKPDCPRTVQVRSPDGTLRSVALSETNTDFVQVEDARTCYADSSTPASDDLTDTDVSAKQIRAGCWIDDDPDDGDAPGDPAALAHRLVWPWDKELPRVNRNRIEMLIAAGRDDASIRTSLERLARHELGHFLGLGDYARGCWRLETATLPPPGVGGGPILAVNAAVMSYGQLTDGTTVLNKPDYVPPDPMNPVTDLDPSGCFTRTITQRDLADLHAIYHPEAPTNLTVTRQATTPNIYNYYDTYWSLSWNDSAGSTPLAHNSHLLGVFRRPAIGPVTWELYGTVDPLNADGERTDEYTVADSAGVGYEWAIAGLTRGDHRPADGTPDPLGLRHTTWPIDGQNWTAGDPSNAATAPEPDVVTATGTYTLHAAHSGLKYYGASELGQWRFAYWYANNYVDITNGGSPRRITINAGDLVISRGQAFTTWDDSPFGPTGQWTTPLRIQHGNTTTYITACDTHFHHNDPTVVHYECLIRYAFSPDTDNIPNHITVTHTTTTNSR